MDREVFARHSLSLLYTTNLFTAVWAYFRMETVTMNYSWVTNRSLRHRIQSIWDKTIINPSRLSRKYAG